MKPFLDFAALVAIVAATATAISLFFQFGKLQDYGIPLDVLETTPAQTVSIGIILAVILATILPSFMAQIGRGGRNAGYRVYRHISLLSILSLGIVGIAAEPLQPVALLILMISMFGLIVFELSPFRRWISRKSLTKLRNKYYKALLGTNGKEDAKAVSKYRKYLRSLHFERLKRRNIYWLLSSFGAAPLYILYGAILSIAAAYAVGRFYGWTQQQYLITNAEHSTELVLAVYGDEILITCLDDKHLSFGQGYEIVHFEKASRLVLVPMTFARNGKAMHLLKSKTNCAPHKDS